MMIELANKIKSIARQLPNLTGGAWLDALADLQNISGQLAQAVIDNEETAIAHLVDRVVVNDVAVYRNTEQNMYIRGDDVRKLLQQAKAEGLEEAAKIVKGDAEYYKARIFSDASLALQDAERKIRARIKG